MQQGLEMLDPGIMRGVIVTMTYRDTVDEQNLPPVTSYEGALQCNKIYFACYPVQNIV